MGDDPLLSARLKLNRAHFQANALNDLMKAWLDERPYELSIETEPDTGDQVCRIHIARQPPKEWSVLIGEVIYAMRSALDHAVWALSGIGGDSPKGSEFPIFKDEPAFRNTKRPGGLWKVRGLSPAAVEVVDGVQPFRQGQQEPERHILWVLHELCNADKHRSLNLTNTVLGTSNLELKASGGVSVERSKIRADGMVEDGSELARWSIVFSGDGKVELHGEYALNIAFDEAGHAKGEAVKPSLEMIGGTIEYVLNAFAKTL